MASNKQSKKKNGNTEAAELCQRLGVNKLYVNTKGEYFTERTYAIASEGGDKTKVSCYEADNADSGGEGEVADKAKAEENEKEAAGKQENPKGDE